MLKKLFRQKLFKFILGGSVSAIINLLLIFLIIDKLGFDTPTLRNIANVISIEISLLASFFIYRIWVWPGGSWILQEVLWRQIPLYHLSAGTSVIARIFLLFPLLDWLKIHYAINTLVGVLLSATLNYLIRDRFVFKTPLQQTQEQTLFPPEIYSPEGLAPALENSSSYSRKVPQSEKSREIKLFSILIPAHNEEGCIVETVESITQLLEKEGINYEIIIVHDSSSDRTEELLQKLCSQTSKVRYINNYFPQGFGFSIRCGLENFQGDAVAIVMADSSDSPENIVDYYYVLQEGYDCVFGSRFIKGSKVVDYPSHKLFINRLANLFIKIIFRLKLNDTTNGFKGYRREVIQGIYPLISHHFNLTVEIPLKAIVRGYSYKIIPITWQNRKAGVSKLKIKEMGSRYLFIVLYIWLEKHFSMGDYVRKETQTTLLK